jgi:hypothetical protein
MKLLIEYIRSWFAGKAAAAEADNEEQNFYLIH